MAQAEQPDSYDDELARIDASIADLKIRDMAAAKERTQIASKIQAAQFQRDILAHANQQKAKKAKARRHDGPSRPPTRSHRLPHPAFAAATRAEGPPDWAAPGTPYTGPPGVATDGRTVLVDDPPPTERPAAPPPRRPAADHPPAHHPPEASTRSVQNILLGLGALLLGVAAVVFAGVAVTNPFGRAAILAVATAIALIVAPGVARRGLSSTAETVAAVGLVLLPMTLYALHGSAVLGGGSVPAPVFLGVTLSITAAAAFVYAGNTRLNAPRYATVVALQPVPPLLAYPMIESPAGWGMALATVALLDLLLLTTVIRRGRIVPRWPVGRPAAGDREGMAEVDARDIGATDYANRDAVPDPADPAAYAEDAPFRPESRPEEPDLIIGSLAGPRRRWLPTRIFPGRRPEGAPAAGSVPLAPPATPPSANWLRELTFALLCVAVAGALLYAGGALIGADAVVDAVRSGLILVLSAVIASAAARLLDNVTARNIAGGVLTLTIIGACARVADVASPSWTLVVAAAAVACTGAVVGLVPEDVRRGPQLASAGALSLIGLFVAVDALRAALAPVQAARPVWNADTAAYAERIAAAAGQSGWLLALSALLLTVAAALALPTEWRHEGAVAGVALTALAVPSSLGLPWSEAPWPLVLAAIGLGATGLMARTRRIAIAHVAAAAVVGLFGAGAALERGLAHRGGPHRAGRVRCDGRDRGPADPRAPVRLAGRRLGGRRRRVGAARRRGHRRAGRVRSRRRATGHRGRHRARARGRLPRRGRHPDVRGGVPGRPARDQPAADRRHRPRRDRDGPRRADGAGRHRTRRLGGCAAAGRGRSALLRQVARQRPPRRPDARRSGHRRGGRHRGDLRCTRPGRGPGLPGGAAGRRQLRRADRRAGRPGAARGVAPRPGPRPRRRRSRGRRDRRLAGTQRRPAHPRRARPGVGFRSQRVPGQRPARRLAGPGHPAARRHRGRRGTAPAGVVRRRRGMRRARHDRCPGRVRPALVGAGAGRWRGRPRVRHGRRWPRSIPGPRWPARRSPWWCRCTSSGSAWPGHGPPRSHWPWS